MTDQMQSIRDDLEFMKALALEGRRAPPLGGAILLAAGLIWGATSLVAWALAKRLIAAASYWQGLVWVVALALFFVALTLLVRRHKGKPGHAALSNRAMAVAWSAAGWSILAFCGAVAAASWRLHSAIPTVLIAPYVLAVYGLGWTVASAMAGKRWLFWVGMASFAAAVALGFLANTENLYLGYAAALVLLVSLPGYLLLRQEPAAIV
jgi:hypothetical protein